MDIKNFQRALAQIAETRGISPESIIETIEAALATAYKKDYGQKGQKIKAKFNQVSGDAQFWQLKLVVDESMLYTPEEIEELKSQKLVPAEDFDRIQEGEAPPKKVVFNPEKHIILEDAKKKDKKIQLGEELEIPLVSKQDYGRIAAQTAKQVILQKIREAEKDVIAAEYKSKEGEIISGVVQRIEGSTVLVDIGKTLGILNREEHIPGEFYKQGQRLKFYILKVEDTPKGSAVMLSRAYPKLVSRLFELEVPEISGGIVVIKSIAREPGYRTKIAVASTEERIDPIGSCFPGKSLVLMEDFTYRPIVEIVKGDRVITHSGNQKLVTDTFKRVWNGTMLKFKVFGIHETIEATKEHPMLFTEKNGAKIEFTEASKIKEGYLAIPIIRNIVSDKTIHYFEKEKDFLWVLGMYLAEGSLDRTEVNFTLSSKEMDKALRIKTIMDKYGGRVFIRHSEYRPSVLDVKICGKYWEELFKELGGEYCDRKKINSRLMLLEPELQLEIFNGWKDGDGHFNKQKNRTIVVTTSENLLWQMYHILLRNNIRANMQKRKDRERRKTAYQMEIAHGKTKDYRGFFSGDYYFSKIRKVEKGASSPGRRVYNLEVQDDNSYVVYSVAVHNCVGQRGTRIMAVINELGGEKIDVIAWNEDPQKYVANSLSPAKIAKVEINENNSATVFVPEDQLSLAIGKEGRNVRLAAQLTGWKIDIKAVATATAPQNNAESNAEENAETEEKPKKKTKKAKKEEASEEKAEEAPAEEAPLGHSPTGEAKE